MRQFLRLEPMFTSDIPEGPTRSVNTLEEEKQNAECLDRFQSRLKHSRECRGAINGCRVMFEIEPQNENFR